MEETEIQMLCEEFLIERKNKREQKEPESQKEKDYGIKKISYKKTPC